MKLTIRFFRVPRLTISPYDEDHGYVGHAGLVK